MSESLQRCSPSGKPLKRFKDAGDPPKHPDQSGCWLNNLIPNAR